MWRESEPPAVAGGLALPQLGQTIDQPPATAGGSDSRHEAKAYRTSDFRLTVRGLGLEERV